MVLKAEPDGNILAGEHTEDLPGVDGHVQGLESVPTIPMLLQRGDVGHLIYTVVLDDTDLAVEGDHVVVLIVPGECVRADHIEGAVLPVVSCLLHRVLEVFELDLPILGDPIMDRIHIIVDGLIHGLDPILHIDLAL